MEYGGHLGKVAFLRFLLNQRSQGQHLIHGHVQLFRPCLHFCREHIVRLAQQLADDLLCRGRGIHFIGIGCKVALQHILALGNVAGSKHIGDIVVILELFPGFAQVQEFRAVAQHTVGHQLGSELLNGPAGNHGNGAYQRIAVPLGQLVGNFLHGHGLIQGIAAGLNFLSHACKVAIILEHRLGANQICFFQVGGHTAQALTAFHRKGNPCGVCSIHRSQIFIVNFIPHSHQQPDNDHQGSGHHQNRANDPPQTAVPIKTVFTFIPHAAVGVVTFFACHAFTLLCRDANEAQPPSPGKPISISAASVMILKISAKACCI